MGGGHGEGGGLAFQINTAQRLPKADDNFRINEYLEMFAY